MTITKPQLEIGTIGSDLVVRQVQVGGDMREVMDFRFAIKDRIYRGGDWVDATIWITCTAWGPRAKVLADNRAKGDQIGLFLKWDFQYQDDGSGNWSSNGPDIYTRNDGSSGAKWSATVEEIVFLHNPKSGGKANIAGQSAPPLADDDDIPF